MERFGGAEFRINNLALRAQQDWDNDIENSRGTLYTDKCYNEYMQYYCNQYFHRYYRGIVVISELAARNGTYYQLENAFNNCVNKLI